MTSKITEIATSLLNGNWMFNEKKIKRLSKTEFLNLIQEYQLISGQELHEVIQSFKRY